MPNPKVVVIAAADNSLSIEMPLASSIDWGLPTFVGFRLDGTPVYMGQYTATLNWDLLAWSDVDNLLQAYYDNTMARRRWNLSTWDRYGFYQLYSNCFMDCPTYDNRDTFFCRGVKAIFRNLRSPTAQGGVIN